MKMLLRLAVAGSLLFPAPALAGATLRVFRELNSGTVRLSDLFDGVADAQDRDLGPSPAPGDRLIVEAAQLAAIARDFGVDWRPQTGTERIVLERSATPLSLDAIIAALRPALITAGAPIGAEISLPGLDPPMVASGVTPRLEIAQISYDPPTGRFTAILFVTAPDMPPLRARLSGEVVRVTEAAVTTRHLRLGSVLAADDVKMERIRLGLVEGHNPVPVSVVLGMALRHDMGEGQAITSADLTRPVLVARNSTVRLSLNADGIVLTAVGTALEDGTKGDRIRIQNPSSRAVIVAQVTGDGEAVAIPGTPPVRTPAP
jgi:flagella basal body P-ring formation protein FlgA